MYCHQSAPSERGPKTPFRALSKFLFHSQVFLSFLPPSLSSPLSFSSSLECRTHSAPCSFDRVAPSPFISYSSLGPPAVFVAGSPRSHSDSVTWPQIAISRLPPWLPHLGHLFLLGGEPFVSVHGHLPPLSPSLCGRRFIRKRTCSRHVTSEAEEERRGDGNE